MTPDIHWFHITVGIVAFICDENPVALLPSSYGKERHVRAAPCSSGDVSNNWLALKAAHSIFPKRHRRRLKHHLPAGSDIEESEEGAGCEREGRLVKLARIAAEVIAAGDAVVRYRARAENCRKAAEDARSDIDKEAWIQLANEWTKLADNIERDPNLETGRVRPR